MSRKRYLRNERHCLSAELDNSRAGLRHLSVRAAAVIGLAVVMVLLVLEVRELRGELVLRRFYYFERLADKSIAPELFAKTVESAADEAELVMSCSGGNPDAMWEITVSCLCWASRDELEPVLRLRLAETAVRASVLGVYAAPSDYEHWLWLARAQAAIGQSGQAQITLGRAQELAPPGMRLELFPSHEARDPDVGASQQAGTEGNGVGGV